MLYSDLRELKVALEIEEGNESEDKKLALFLEWASAWIEEYLNRPGMTLRSRTEYYDGTGTGNLLLRSRPVFTSPTIQVYENTRGYYGQPDNAFPAESALTYGSDFVLRIDQENGSSRSGILTRINAIWPKPYARQPGYLSPYVTQDTGSIKVVYSGGHTVDTLPAPIREACVFLVTRMRYLFPLGMELGSESYEERNISIIADKKNYLTSLVKPLLFTYRNWKF